MIRNSHAVRLLMATLVAGLISLGGCSRSPEAKKARFVARGKAQLEAKDYSRAILNFQNALRFGQKDPEVHYQLALAYLASGDPNTAVALLRRTSKLNPSHVGAQLKLAEMMAQTGDRELIEKAEMQAQAVLSASPENSDALDILGIAELQLGRPEDAQKHFEEALARFPNRLQSAVNLARLKLLRKDLTGAEEVLRKVAEQKPPSAIAIVALAQFYSSTNRTADAEQTLRRALQLAPREGSALLGLAAVQMRNGKMDDAEAALKTLSGLPDKNYNGLYGAYLFQRGKRDLAISEFGRLVKQYPTDRNARTRLVSAYLATNRRDEANQLLSAVLKKNSNDVDALLQRAAITLQFEGDYASARKDLDQVIHFRDTSPEAHILLARLFAAQGAPLRQRQELNEALRLDPNQLAARIELCHLLIKSNSARAALDLMNNTPAAQQQAVSYTAAKNWALLAIGEKLAVRKNLDSLVPRLHSAELLRQDAVLKFEAKNYIGARTAATEALKKDPEDVAALALLAATYRIQNQNAAALSAVLEQASKVPQSARVQYFLGSVLKANGDLASARNAFTAAKNARTAFTDADIELAQLDLVQRKPDDARKRLTAVLAGAPNNIRARLLAAQLDLNADNRGGAIEHYRKVLETDSRNAFALNNISCLLAEGNNADEALKYAQEAKEVDPHSPAVEDTIGWALYHKGMYSMAVKHLETAVADDDTPVRQYHLAMAYAKNGEMTRGRRVFDTAMKKEPTSPEAKKAQELFK